jgi:ubiquinone/menaquinone biosynthesis C-methylase UbiE
MRAGTLRPPSPIKVQEDMWAAWRSFALAAAFKLDLFSHADAGKRTATELASAIGANARAVERLCDAMVALKYLRKRGDNYHLTPIARTYLVRGSELYMEGFADLANQAIDRWMRLAEVVRSGKPVETSEPSARAEFFQLVAKAIFPLSYVAAKAAVAALPRAVCGRIRNILDIGAGSAAWSLPFIQALPDARATALDLPQVLEVTRQYTTRYGVAERYEYVAGDLNEMDFGRQRYDLVILGQILHGEDRGAARRLLEKSAEALREKGMILIGEFIPSDQRDGPPAALLFGLNMLLNTPGGDVYTMREYREWLKAAGLKSVKTIAVPLPSPLILATK